MPAIAEVQFKARDAQTVVNAFKSIGTEAANTTTKIGQTSTAIKTLGGSGTLLAPISRSITSVGAPLNNLNRSFETASRSSQTFGQRVSSVGSRFGALGASAAGLGGSLIGLTRQYQDLSDSQIRVDRVTLKLSRSQEALRTAQDKLAALQAKGIRSGKEYEKALLDVSQAEDQVKIQTDLLREAQEDHQRAQEDFWVGLVPTIATAGATIIGVLTDLMGKKGFGGVTEAIGNATVAIGGGGAGGKGGGKGGGFLGALKGIPGTLGAGGGAIAGGVAGGATLGIGIGEFARAKQAELEKSGLFSGDFQHQMEQANVIIQKLHVSLNDIFMDADGIKQKFTEAGGVIDSTGVVIGETTTKTAALGQTTAQVIPQLNGYARVLAENEAAYRNGTKEYGPFLEAAQHVADAMGITLPQALELGKNGILQVTEATRTVAPALQTVAPALQTASVAAQGMAANVKFLDSNLQPIPPIMQQMAEALGTANASLGVSVDIGAQYVATIDSQIKAEDERQIALFNTAQSLGIKNANEDDEIGLLELLIQQQRAAKAGDYDRVKSLGALISQMQKANKVAAQGVGHRVVSQGAVGQGKGSWKYFVNGKLVSSGPGSAPPLVGGSKGASGYSVVHRQHGFFGTVKRPTLFTVAEGGRPEDISVTPRGSRGGRGGAGGGRDIYIGPIYLGGEKIMDIIRYKMTENSSIFR